MVLKEKHFFLGTIVHTLLAKDADSSTNENNLIKFSKLRSSEQPAGERFEVLPDGRIKLLQKLNSEVQQKFQFEVVAEDRNGNSQGQLQFF